MATNTEELKLIISGDGRLLGKEIKKEDREIKSFTSRTESAFTRMHKRINSGLGRLIKSPIAGMATGMFGGAAILYAGKQMIDYDEKLYRLGIQSGITAKEQMKLKQEIDSVAFASGQSRSGIMAGIDKIVEQTGDLQFAKDTMKDLAIASTATGAGMEYMGALAVQLRDKLSLSKEEIGQAMNLLTVQGKAGAFTLENMATMGERLFAAAGRFDMKGLKSLGNFGSFIQIARMGTGSSEQATTSVESVLADILDKQKEIKKAGFNILGPNNKIKSFDEIIKGIIKATKGSEFKLGSIFGRESIRSVSVLAKLYRDTGGFALFDQLANADAERSGELLKDFARYSESAKYQLQQLSNIAWDFADSGLTPIIKDLNLFISDLTSDPQKLAAFREEIRGIGENIGTTAKSVMDLVEALSKFIPLLKIAGVVVDYTTSPFQVGQYLANDYAGDKKSADQAIAGFNALSPEERKRRIAQLESTGKMSIRNDQKTVINNQITIAESGRVVSETDNPNTKINTNVSRGTFPGVRKK